MKELIVLKKYEQGVDEALKKFCPDFNYVCFDRYERLIVSLLTIAMNDKYNWISYWLYDLDCGNKARPNTVKEKTGKNIPCKTIKDLYNLIKSGI